MHRELPAKMKEAEHYEADFSTFLTNAPLNRPIQQPSRTGEPCVIIHGSGHLNIGSAQKSLDSENSHIESDAY